MNNRIIISNQLIPIDHQEFEVVERKGIGHPDTLADGIAEKLSLEYAKYCLKKFGVVLHHNLDKVVVTGGLVNIDFGKGKMIKPAKLFINGRMSDSFGNQKINIADFQRKVVFDYLPHVLPHFDPHKWLEFHSFTNTYSHNPYWYHPRGPEDLPDSESPHANDTSTCIGYWPLSLLERVVLGIEGYFYTREGNSKYSYIGQDIKIMATRVKQNIHVIACIPFISSYTPHESFYKTKLKKIRQRLIQAAKKMLPPSYSIDITINTADNPSKHDYYLLLTGSCIEAGEEGVVGRGNHSRGTIACLRPHSMEAPAGKNPVYFVGKVMNVLGDSLSRAISTTFDCYCDVIITTRNKDPLFKPAIIHLNTSKKIPSHLAFPIVKKHLSYAHWTRDIINKSLLLPRPGKGNVYYLT